MSRLRLTSYWFASSLGFTLLTMIVGLVATPFILAWLGHERLGAYRALVDWLGYLALLELGLAGALLPLFNQHPDDPETQRAVLRLGIRSYAKVALMTLVAGAAAFPFVQVLIPTSEGVQLDLRVAFLVGVGSALLLPFSPFKWFLEAAQRGYLVNLLGTVQSLLTIGLCLAFAWAGYGITGQVLGALAGQVVLWAGLRVVAGRVLPRPTQGLLSAPTPPELRQALRRLNWPQWILDLCGRVSLATDNIVVGLLLGPRVIVPFFLTQRLCGIGGGILQALGGASWAALGDLHARGEHEVLRARLAELSKLIAVVGVCGLVPVVALNRVFIGLWIGPENYAGDLVTLLAAANALVFALLYAWVYCFVAVGQVRHLVPLYVCQAALNLGLSLALTSRLGYVGPLIGTLASFTLVSLWWLPLLLRRSFGVPLGALARALLPALTLGAVAGGAAWWWASRHPPAGWLQLALAMAALAVALLALSAGLLFDREERARWRERLRALRSGA